MFLIAMGMLLSAHSASRNIAFFYASGSLFGVLLMLGAFTVYLFHNGFMQSRAAKFGTVLLGTSLPSAWYYFQDSLTSTLMRALEDPLSWSPITYTLVFGVATASFIAFYMFAAPVPKHFDLLEIIMRLVGSFLLLFSVQSVSLALIIAVVANLVVQYLRPVNDVIAFPSTPTVMSPNTNATPYMTPTGPVLRPIFTPQHAIVRPATPPLTFLRRLTSPFRSAPRPSPLVHAPASGTHGQHTQYLARAYLSAAEYEAEGKAETARATAELRQRMLSAPQYMVQHLSRIGDPKRLQNTLLFLAGHQEHNAVDARADVDDDDDDGLDGFSVTSSDDDGEAETRAAPVPRPKPVQHNDNKPFSYTASATPALLRRGLPSRAMPVPRAHVNTVAADIGGVGNETLHEQSPVRASRSGSTSTAADVSGVTAQEIRTCSTAQLLKLLKDNGLQGGPITVQVRMLCVCVSVCECVCVCVCVCELQQ